MEDAKAKIKHCNEKINEIVMDLLSMETFDVDTWNNNMEQESTRSFNASIRISSQNSSDDDSLPFPHRITK